LKACCSAGATRRSNEFVAARGTMVACLDVMEVIAVASLHLIEPAVLIPLRGLANFEVPLVNEHFGIVVHGG